jgi:hypothetical protein
MGIVEGRFLAFYNDELEGRSLSLSVSLFRNFVFKERDIGTYWTGASGSLAVNHMH